MGYTHYWQSRGFTPEQWAQLQRAARTIARRSAKHAARLAGWDGTGRPYFGADRIACNGLGDSESFETLAISSGPDQFAFCKTGRRPYDAAVVALLIVAARINPGFTWRSDGDASEHAMGAALAADLPAKGAAGGAATVRE